MFNSIKEYYDSIASGYDELYGEEQLKKLRFAVENGLRVYGKKVIDVGCGTGLIIEELLRLGAAEVTGIDLSEGMIEIAKKRLRNNSKVRLMVGNALALPFEDRSFDLCVSFTVLQDVPKEYWKAFVGECLRVSTEVWITVLKRNKTPQQILKFISRVPNVLLEETKDYVMVFFNENLRY